MNKFFPFFLLCVYLISCNNDPQIHHIVSAPYDENALIDNNADHEDPRMRFQLIQSRLVESDSIWKDVGQQLKGFTEAEYEKLSPFIYEKEIPTIQAHIRSGYLTYEKLIQWYLYRIVKFETDSARTLHTILSINPNAVKIARQKDRQKSEGDHLIFGMPILLKDNIDTRGMPTTAGAAAFMENRPEDAFIVKRLKERGAIILGKVNLSEWAYLLGRGLPLGYSAVGGQTLNPYGRMRYHTGGSSSGSATAMAANYAAGAVGTETSGSILSPSGANSAVGLKPTVGLLSRTGIVPISFTLDTPGPITRSVTDNAILLSAMTGEDDEDEKTIGHDTMNAYWKELDVASLDDKRFGIFREFLTDSLYQNAIKMLIEQGADTVGFTGDEIHFQGFLDLLVGEMKIAFTSYLRDCASDNIEFRTPGDIVTFNRKDTFNRIPYGQSLFEYMATVSLSEGYLDSLRHRFHFEGVRYFSKEMEEESLDAVLSINNYHAGHAAMARYPCLIVPMGYSGDGEPKGLAFIGRPREEQKLLNLGFAFEKATNFRNPPDGY
jgi:amidase